VFVNQLVKDLKVKAGGSADDGARGSIPGKKRTAHKAAEQVKDSNHQSCNRKVECIN